MIFGTNKSPRAIPGAATCVFFLGLALLLAACEQKPTHTPPPPPKVTVAQPVRRNVTDYLEFTGNTQAVNTVQLRARVEGYLEKVFFQDGETVKEGQPLFLIQQNTYQARLQEAEGNVLTQKHNLEHAEIELARAARLFKQNAGSEMDVQNWRHQRDSAQAALLTAQAQRDLARLDLGYTSVAAPFNGRIDRRLVDPGNLVGTGTNTVLAEIRQMDPLYVYFTVSETDMSRLMGNLSNISEPAKSSKHPVYIGLANDEGYPHEGYLDFAATSVNPATGTLLTRGVVPNREATMLPGQFARVKVPVGKERSAVLVPQVAVGFDQLGSFVLAVNERNVVERIGVQTGARHDGLYVIEEGLKGDERVVVKGLVHAAPGRQVTAVEEGTESKQHGAGSVKQEAGSEVQQ